MVVAARAAFWTLSRPNLFPIASYLGVEVERSIELFDLCFALVQNVLQCSDAEAMKVMQKRYAAMHRSLDSETLDIFMSLDEGLQCLDKDDADEVRRAQRVTTDQRAEATEFGKAYREMKRKVDPPPPPPRTGKGRGRGRGAGGNSRRSRDTPPKVVPPGAITQSQARLLLPPGPIGQWVLLRSDWHRGRP